MLLRDVIVFIWVWVRGHLASFNVCTRCFSLYDMSSPGTMASVEEKVFVKYYPKLKEVVNPGDITASLFAKGLLSADEKDSADHMMHTHGDRMTKLLDGVRRAIKGDTKKFYIFLHILGTVPKYEVLVKKISEESQSVYNSWVCGVGMYGVRLCGMSERWGGFIGVRVYDGM